MAYRFFFFAGGDHQEGEGNAFTANFIRYLTDILGGRFSVIKGIYHTRPLMNVIWALNHAQEPEKRPGRNRIIVSSVNQIISGLGICFPFLTFKFNGPSFLNTNPVTGHLHRVRAQSVQKAKDFLKTILVDYKLGGDEAKGKAEEKIRAFKSSSLA